jgi:putative aldouronate transport system permease protein
MVSKEDWIFQGIAHVIMALVTIAAILPFLLLLGSSFTNEIAVVRNGYSFFPSDFSLTAYAYLWNTKRQIGNAYLITLVITSVGTAVSLLITTLYAYPLSRRDLPNRNFFAFFAFFTMLFNGGLVPTYLLYTDLLHIKNSIWALIIPRLLMSAFNVLLARTYFQHNIPCEMVESAQIDGEGEYGILFKIILPLGKPILVTIGLFTGLNYWNDWLNGLYYVTDPKYYSIQNLLTRILLNIEFLSTNSNVYDSTNELAKLPTATARMAIAVVGVIPILVAYPFFQKYFMKGITVGAVKG